MADEADELPEQIETPEVVAEPQEPDPTKDEQAEEGSEEPTKKDPVAQLKGRVGHLTKSLHAKDAALAERDARIAALEAGRTGEPLTEDVKKAALEELRAEQAQLAFNAECNEVFDAGTKEFKAEFQEAVAALNSTGHMQRPMIEAALASGTPTDAAKVLHHLGNDLDEAERIAKLSPIRMAAELTKLAVKLGGAKARTSNAPAPIKPIGGSTKPELDIYDPNLSQDEYYERRKKSGNAPWLQ